MEPAKLCTAGGATYCNNRNITLCFVLVLVVKFEQKEIDNYLTRLPFRERERLID
jgi:hypothetical protein